MPIKQPKIIIIPGWTYSLEKILPLEQELRALGYRARTLPVPGLTGEKLLKAWSLTEYRLWLKKELRGETEVVLVGHSNGGRIILSYLAAGLGEQQVQATVLIASAGLVDNCWRQKLKRQIGKCLATLGKGLKKVPGLRTLVYRLLGERDYLQASEVMRLTMSSLIAEDLRSQVGKIRVPALLIWGQQDRQTPFYLGQELASLLPTSQLVSIKSARHNPIATHLSTVVATIHKFLESRRGQV